MRCAFGIVLRDATHVAAVVQVAVHGKMGEQPAFLKNVTNVAQMGRHVDALRRIEQDRVFERDAAAVWLDEARDHVGDGGLAGAG